MNISKKDINALTAELSITLSPADYETKVENAIKKVQKQASLPGFRPGKVPVGLIKKQHGKSILVDEINKILNETLYNYINDNKIEILGIQCLKKITKSILINKLSGHLTMN
jgi:trigger factor